jgi:hypothetical protein
LDIEEVSSQLKKNYANHLTAWHQVLGEFEATNKMNNG